MAWPMPRFYGIGLMEAERGGIGVQRYGACHYGYDGAAHAGYVVD